MVFVVKFTKINTTPTQRNTNISEKIGKHLDSSCHSVDTLDVVAIVVVMQVVNALQRLANAVCTIKVKAVVVDIPLANYFFNFGMRAYFDDKSITVGVQCINCKLDSIARIFVFNVVKMITCQLDFVWLKLF